MFTQEEKNSIAACVGALFQKMGCTCEVAWQELSQDDRSLSVLSVTSSENLSPLIGSEGKNLEAIEHLAHIIVRRALPPREGSETPHFMLDINGYRVERTTRLVSLARESAHRVIATGRAESLMPMSAYQRRIVHSELAAIRSVATESIGAEPHRRIVIKPAALRTSDTLEGLKGSF